MHIISGFRSNKSYRIYNKEIDLEKELIQDKLASC